MCFRERDSPHCIDTKTDVLEVAAIIAPSLVRRIQACLLLPTLSDAGIQIETWFSARFKPRVLALVVCVDNNTKSKTRKASVLEKHQHESGRTGYDSSLFQTNSFRQETLRANPSMCPKMISRKKHAHNTPDRQFFNHCLPKP